MPSMFYFDISENNLRINDSKTDNKNKGERDSQICPDTKDRAPDQGRCFEKKVDGAMWIENCEGIRSMQAGWLEEGLMIAATTGQVVFLWTEKEKCFLIPFSSSRRVTSCTKLIRFGNKGNY